MTEPTIDVETNKQDSFERDSDVEAIDATSTEPQRMSKFEVRDHLYCDGERCTHCGVNVYDAAIYGPEYCDREPITYTTETPND